MKLFTLNILGLLVISPLQVWALPSGDSQALSQSKRNVDLAYTDDKGMRWNGPIFKGKANYTLFGDAKSIYDQILAINPKYLVSDHEQAIVPAGTTSLNPRSPSAINCDFTHLVPERRDIWTGQNYLQRIGGSCQVRGGPSACVRLTCNNNSGIFLCNDNRNAIHPSCAYLATYPDNISHICSGGNPNFSGQQFDTDHYNVIVDRADCSTSATIPPPR